MAEWIERVDRGTSPVILHEHVLRYAFAMPLINGSSVWVDLGCGTGAAAAEALQGAYRGRLILVDNDPTALDLAQREFHADELVSLEADLSDPAELSRVEEALSQGGPDAHRCITCFEVIEHLDNFEPLIGHLVNLAETKACTVSLSVPNDAFSGVDNPYHETVWGEASVEELRSVLPKTHVFGAQYSLSGSCIQLPEEPTRHQINVDVAADGVPSHYLLAFGPRATEVTSAAAVTQIDLDEHRAWERRREADLDYYQQWADELAGRRPADGRDGT
jgi:2-polyprenyl-3-methyl-5-hydroxy-6-metoxy-1,4-benzoquinol methylase